jgi:hypothetical protein
MSDTFTCDNCGGTFGKMRPDEEAEAEAQELFPGIDVTDPEESGVVCDDCFDHIMGRVRAEAPELIGEGWREAADLGITEEELAREQAALDAMEPAFVPGIGMVSGLAAQMLRETAWMFGRPADGSRCYRTESGFRVHVKPGCRCPR